MKCETCGHDIDECEHYVTTKDKKTLCENCFFDLAIEKLEAEERCLAYEEETE
ncbi:MAG: hypothetical protein WBA84_06765 [Carnobacterium sp.]|uniref:hypothetical protein n=1 Tax=Carnobacterium sp. TaxID=48221 RepID=UPI003C7136D9